MSEIEKKANESYASNFVLPISAGTNTDVALIGGKGHGLVALVQNGFPVPQGFIITTGLFRESILNSLSRLKQADVIAAVKNASIPNTVWNDIRKAFRYLLENSPVHGVAVRSSAVGEDQKLFSSAGVQRTYLNVHTETQLLEAIKGCWLSFFAPESFLYQARNGNTDDLPLMAVIVQEMIPAGKAGVVFTRDPRNASADEMVISSAWGLGENVVKGSASDTYRLKRSTGEVKETEIARKAVKLVSAVRGGVEEKQINSQKRKQSSLSKSELSELYKTSLSAVEKFKRELDIEWAFDEGGKLWLLQARPITTGTANGDEKISVWSNVNVAEALPGVATPATWSIIRRFSRMGFENAFSALGVSVPGEYELVSGFRGRIYLNLTQFMELASGIPFFEAERLLYMGGGEMLPELKESFKPRSPLKFILKMPLTLPKIGISQLSAPLRAKLWIKKFNEERDKFFAMDLGSKHDKDFLALFDYVTGVFNKTGTLMLACASNALSSYIMIDGLLEKLPEKELKQEAQFLFSGLGNLSSAQPGYALLEIAREIRKNSSLETGFKKTSPETGLKFLQENTGGTKAYELFNRFIKEYGYRAPKEAELATPRWRESPVFLVKILQTMLESPHLPSQEEILELGAKSRKRAAARVRTSLPRLSRPVFSKLLASAQAAALLREEMRTLVVDTLSMYRTIFLEAGKRAKNRALLFDQNDIFFLTYQEITDLLNDKIPQEILFKVVVRKQEFEVFSNTPPPPDTFILRNGHIIAPANIEPEFETIIEEGEVILKGIAGSPGRVTGKARIIKSPEEGNRLKPGEIMIAPQTDVGWTPLFLVSSGVVTDLGGLLSHSCIVAREYGIPAVVNTRNAVKKLRDGELITVDGTRGIVYRRSKS